MECIEVRCDPVTLPCKPCRTVSAVKVSMCRESGSSLSSQCISTCKPRSAAMRHKTSTDFFPSSIVRSKCGIPPTTSTPRSRAVSRSSDAIGVRKKPSCGKATSCKSRYGATSFLTSRRASTANKRGSQIST